MGRQEREAVCIRRLVRWVKFFSVLIGYFNVRAQIENARLVCVSVCVGEPLPPEPRGSSQVPPHPRAGNGVAPSEPPTARRSVRRPPIETEGGALVPSPSRPGDRTSVKPLHEHFQPQHGGVIGVNVRGVEILLQLMQLRWPSHPCAQHCLQKPFSNWTLSAAPRLSFTRGARRWVETAGDDEQSEPLKQEIDKPNVWCGDGPYRGVTCPLEFGGPSHFRANNESLNVTQRSRCILNLYRKKLAKLRESNWPKGHSTAP